MKRLVDELFPLDGIQQPGALLLQGPAAQIAPSPTACYWLGRALESKGDYRRASSAYAAALQLAPGMAEARTRLQALQSKTSERR